MVKECIECAIIPATVIFKEAESPASNKFIKAGQSGGFANDLPPNIDKITIIALIIVKQCKVNN